MTTEASSFAEENVLLKEDLAAVVQATLRGPSGNTASGRVLTVRFAERSPRPVSERTTLEDVARELHWNAWLLTRGRR